MFGHRARFLFFQEPLPDFLKGDDNFPSGYCWSGLLTEAFQPPPPSSQGKAHRLLLGHGAPHPRPRKVSRDKSKVPSSLESFMQKEQLNETVNGFCNKHLPELSKFLSFLNLVQGIQRPFGKIPFWLYGPSRFLALATEESSQKELLLVP